MKKVADVLQEIDAALRKEAFIPNPHVMKAQQGGGGAGAGGGQQQQGQQPQQGQGGDLPVDPGAGGPNDPASGGPQPGADDGEARLMELIQKAPPELQQEIMPVLEQLQSMPPEQKAPAIQQITQQLEQTLGGMGMDPAAAQAGQNARRSKSRWWSNG
jgi:hypothetical protein